MMIVTVSGINIKPLELIGFLTSYQLAIIISEKNILKVIK